MTSEVDDHLPDIQEPGEQPVQPRHPCCQRTITFANGGIDHPCSFRYADCSGGGPIGIVALMPREATPDRANAPAQVMKA